MPAGSASLAASSNPSAAVASREESSRSGGGGGGGKYEVEEDDYGEPDLVDAVADAKAAASRSGNSLPEVSYDDDAEPLDDDSYDDTFEEDESPPLPE